MILRLVSAIGIRAPIIVTPESLLNIITDTSILFMLALVQMIVILTRGINLSVAANLAMAGMLTRCHLAPCRGCLLISLFSCLLSVGWLLVW